MGISIIADTTTAQIKSSEIQAQADVVFKAQVE